jgi:hypothetical protein
LVEIEDGVSLNLEVNVGVFPSLSESTLPVGRFFSYYDIDPPSR